MRQANLLLIVLAIAPACSRSHSAEEEATLFPVMVNRKFGFIDSTGRTVISPRFDGVQDFSEGVSVATVADQQGLIDEHGGWLVNPRPWELGIMHEGLCSVRDSKSHLWGYIDRAGKYMGVPQFELASYFSHGLARVKLGNKWGFIDKTGQFAIPPQFEDAGPFSADGLAAVRLGSAWGFIQRDGKIVITPQYSKVDDFREGLAAVTSEGLAGYIDTKGTFVIPPQFAGALSFHDSIAEVYLGGQIAWINKAGKLLDTPGEPHFSDNNWTPRRGLAVYQSQGQCGYATVDGTVHIGARFASCSPFEGALAEVVVTNTDNNGEVKQTEYIATDGHVVWREPVSEAAGPTRTDTTHAPSVETEVGVDSSVSTNKPVIP